MLPRRLRGLDFRSPPPEYEFADGTVLQTRYLENADWALYDEYEADQDSIEKLVALLTAIVPGLTPEFINSRVTFGDTVNLISIGKGHADVLAVALKNGRSDGVRQAPSPTPDSPTTTISPVSAPG